MQRTINKERIYQILILLLAVLLFWKWHCGNPCPAIKETVVIDTVFEKSKDSSPWTKPVPVAIKPGKAPSPKIVQLPGKTDTFWRHTDTAAILADHYAKVEYDTTYKFPEADIRVQNNVSENRIQSQRVVPSFNIPTITKTVIKTEQAKKRGQLYIGADVFGGPNELLYGTSVSLAWKTKRDKMYEFGPAVFRDQPLMYRAGAKFLISFRKK